MPLEKDLLRGRLTKAPDPAAQPDRQRLVAAAVRMLEAYGASQLPLQLAHPDRIDDKPIDHSNNDAFDNVMIHSGVFLAALAYSCSIVRETGLYHARRGEPFETEKRNLAAIVTGLSGILSRLEHLNNAGYVTRWKQSSLTSRAPGDWQAEPSLDEYSGMLLGLSWARRYVPKTSIPSWYNAFHERIDSLLRDVNKFLVDWDGWIIHPGGDLTIRGPQLVGSSFPLRRFFEHWVDSLGTNIQPFRNAHPLQATPTARFLIGRSHQWIRRHGYDTAYVDCVDEYRKTLRPLDLYLAATNAIDAIFALFPFGVGGVLELIGLIPVLASDEQVWTVFAKALAFRQVNDQGYNAQIFDRFTLACAELGDLKAIWANRGRRDIDADRLGWQCLTEACRVCFDAPFRADDVLATLMRNVEAFESSDPKVCLENGEGFVLAWAVLCAALNIDPGIDWSRVFSPDELAPPSDYDVRELDAVAPPPPPPPYPLLRMWRCTLDVVVARDAEMFPTLWIIPVLLRHGPDGTWRGTLLEPAEVVSIRYGEVDGLKVGTGYGVGPRSEGWRLEPEVHQSDAQYLFVLTAWNTPPTIDVVCDPGDPHGHLSFTYHDPSNDIYYYKKSLQERVSQGVWRDGTQIGSLGPAPEVQGLSDLLAFWDSACVDVFREYKREYIGCALVLLHTDGTILTADNDLTFTRTDGAFDVNVVTYSSEWEIGALRLTGTADRVMSNESVWPPL